MAGMANNTCATWTRNAAQGWRDGDALVGPQFLENNTALLKFRVATWS